MGGVAEKFRKQTGLEWPEPPAENAKPDKDLRWYMAEFLSEECLCGKPKKSRYSFCWKCFKELPGEMQRGLYRMIGHGYESSFEEAVKWLQENVW